MNGYSGYRPQGEIVTFAAPHTEDPHAVFAHALRACALMAGVSRPEGYHLYFTCALPDILINVIEPDPSEVHWEVVPESATAPPEYGRPPDRRVRVPALTDTALTDLHRRALRELTCPPGFRVTLWGLAPIRPRTRLVDADGALRDGRLPVELWGAEMALATTADGGETWLGPMPEDGPFRWPPVMFDLDFDCLLYLRVTVHWTRWKEPGTGEHRLLQETFRALMADGWQLQHPSAAFGL